MLEINSTSILNSPKIETNHKATKLLETALNHLTVSKAQENLPDYLWPETRFQLHQSRLWKNLNPDVKKNALSLLSQRNLASSWWIENSGRTYGAKMVILAQTHEEKSLHALFTAEEAIHMREFENFMNFSVNWELHSHPMLKPLELVIKQGDRETLLLIVQVLLEGFGLFHYQSLSEDCLSMELKSTYQRILKDEARHHGTGIVFAQEMNPNKESIDHMFEFSREFINSFVNVDWIQTSIEKYYRPLSMKEIKDLKEDLQTEKINTFRKQKFKEMIQKVDQFGLTERLSQERVF